MKGLPLQGSSPNVPVGISRGHTCPSKSAMLFGGQFFIVSLTFMIRRSAFRISADLFSYCIDCVSIVARPRMPTASMLNATSTSRSVKPYSFEGGRGTLRSFLYCPGLKSGHLHFTAPNLSLRP